MKEIKPVDNNSILVAPSETSITGLKTNDSNTIEEVETTIAESIDEGAKSHLPRNRAERRALAKKMGKRGRAELGTISETAKKLNYINLIEKIRDLNKLKENGGYEDSIEDD